MRSFKKIAAMIMAVAMLCSFTALGAATVDDFTVAGTSTAAPTVTLNYTSDASQNTILAYKGTELEGANIVYIDQLAKNAGVDGVHIALGTDESDVGTYTVTVGGTDVATAKSARFEYTDGAERYAVTMPESVENGTLSASLSAAELANVREGKEVTFTVVPNFGWVLKSLKVGENEVATEVADGTYKTAINDDVTISVEFARANTYENAAYTYTEMYEAEADEDEGNSSTGTNWDSKIFFGKGSNAEKTIISRGMALYVKKDGEYVGFKTKEGEEADSAETVDTYFAADPAKVTSDGKYGIRFYAFGQGDYMVKSYVQYDDLTYDYGDEIKFTVE